MQFLMVLLIYFGAGKNARSAKTTRIFLIW